MEARKHELNPGRILGVVAGLIILAAIFALPLAEGYTFYDIAGPVLVNVGSISDLGDPQTIAFAYVLLVSFLLVVVAGLVGIFPLGAGILGIVGMALLTAGSFVLNIALVWETGFYVIWIASIIALGAAFWRRKHQAQYQPTAGNVTQTVTINTPPAQASQIPQTSAQQLCPTCGQPLTYVDQYQRWYCQNEKKYV